MIPTTKPESVKNRNIALLMNFDNQVHFIKLLISHLHAYCFVTHTPQHSRHNTSNNTPHIISHK